MQRLIGRLVIQVALMLLVPVLSRFFGKGRTALGFRSSLPPPPDHDVGARPLKSALPPKRQEGG